MSLPHFYRSMGLDPPDLEEGRQLQHSFVVKS